MITIDPEKQKQAKQYARIRRRLWLVDTIFSAVYFLAWIVFGWAIALREWLTDHWSLFTNPWLLVPAFAADLWRNIFPPQPPSRLLQRIRPAASFWSIEPDSQRLGHGSDQGTGDRRAPRLDPARIALSRPACDRRSMVVVGGGRTACFQCPADQPCADPDHAVVQQICAAWR